MSTHATSRSTTVPAIAARTSIDAPEEAGADYEVGLESLSQWQLAWRKFRKHRLALIGLGILAVLVVVAIVGPFLMPFDFRDIPQPGPDRLRGPAAVARSIPFGETGGLQRDVLTLVVNGARTSLLIGFSSMVIGVVIGTIVGAIAGFARRLRRQPPDAHRRRDAQPADPVRDPRLRPSSSAAATSATDRPDLRTLQLDGRQPPRAEPVPVDPRTRVRRGGPGRRRLATGGSSSATSCRTPSARSSSWRR